MDDQGCPRCKTTKYRNPSLKLMVNVCGHTLCESCVEMLFIRGSGNCQECDTPLRKSNFRVQLFEDPAIDKEVEIRKKVLKIYNKNDSDFPSLREYNDYLELIEEIVYNLTNNMDLENTKQMMEQYQRENKEIIQKNKIKLTREQEELEELLAMERQENEQRRLLQIKEEKRQVLAKKKNKQALLDELGQKISLQPVPKIEEVLYVYKPIHVETYGPPLPDLENLGRFGYLNHVRAAPPQDLAGGYTSNLACHRAMQDAFSGLFLQSV
ncbi:CDK-activating kinase assembly factor MAT1-like isoform X2 [Acipenser ruthenus]|uniref:CDK-activating kinase assembly factor MAT1-like isoform X2 n=1 Tax=Acipenser ruthenus TaxID=7906 RepID=UPI001560EE89|nr:CDK-activating kinase assembly factor MAT1-like isoform X2 [Acipenser ruthenus]